MGVPTTHPILSMLFTHTTSGPPVLFVAAVSFFVARVEFQVGVLAAEDFSGSRLPLRGFTANC